MQVRFNKENYRLCSILDSGVELKNINLGKLLFLEIPTPLFKEEIGDNATLYVTKTKQVVISQDGCEIVIPQGNYVEFYRGLAKVVTKKFKDVKQIKEYLSYKEFIGLFSCRNINSMIVNAKGEVKFKDSEAGNFVSGDIDSGKYSTLTELQLKTIRELKMRCVR